MNNQSVQILLIDDDLEYSEIMGFWLKSQGYQVNTVGSGEEGVAALDSYTPNIIFLDMDMPGIDGLETLRQIRQRDKTLPVIMITAHGSEERCGKAKALHVSGFFDKSDDYEEAALIIRQSLQALPMSESNNCNSSNQKEHT